MARYLFGPDLILTSITPPAVQLAPAAPFTLWSERAGGVQYTNCTNPDGVTPLTKDAQGRYVADSNGNRPSMRGPDAVVTMWVETGVGDRYPTFAADLIQSVMLSYLNPAPQGLDIEAVQDAVNTMVVAGENITKTYNDTAGTLTLAAAAGATGGTAVSGGFVWQLSTDAARRTVPAGYRLIIIGGSAPPSWMLAGDIQWASA